MSSSLHFKPITDKDMQLILPFLALEKGRSCDFSYGGLLMWVDYFDYQYCIDDDTLFIKGMAPSGNGETAFAMPLGYRNLESAFEMLRDYCIANDMKLEFSAIPEEDKEKLMRFNPKEVISINRWNDYIYDAESLATQKGKKMSKKRNHVNQFTTSYPDWRYERLRPEHIPQIESYTSKAIAAEAQQTEEAIFERKLAAKYLREVSGGNPNIIGGVLSVGDKIIAYTIGDVKGDTLFVHIEKGERSYSGCFETINKCFAQDIVNSYPEVKYINREDDADDPGLRLAKQSYHPIEILKKYNIKF